MLEKFDSIYLDFDGTVAKEDSVCTFLSAYATGNFDKIEQDWIDGKISSKTCMTLQLELIKNVDIEELYRFLKNIKLQDGFVEFVNFAKENNKKITILSDGFDFFIDFILKNNGIENIPFYANKLTFKEEGGFLKFNLDFPYEDKMCNLELGMCKCARVQKNEKFLFAGDGLSDRCIAKKADVVFARKSLKNLCEKENIEFFEFKDFNQIINLLKKGSEDKCKL